MKTSVDAAKWRVTLTNLAALRRDRDETQREVAEWLGALLDRPMPVTYYASIETGSRRAPAAVAEALERKYGLPIAVLQRPAIVAIDEREPTLRRPRKARKDRSETSGLSTPEAHGELVARGG